MISDEVMEMLEIYMDDELREKAHYNVAPCTNDEFLKEYCKLDVTFTEFVQKEFGLDLMDL